MMSRRNHVSGVFLCASCFLWVVLFQSTAASAERFNRRFATKRSVLMVGTMDNWIQRQQQLRRQYPASPTTATPRIQLASSQKTYNPYTEEIEEPAGTIDEEPIPKESIPEQPSASTDTPNQFPVQTTHAPPPKATQESTSQKRKSSQHKIWPPWPFNLLQAPPEGEFISATSTSAGERRGPAARMGGLVWSFFGQRARVSVKEMQDIGSRLWFHLPPMTPPILLLALMPRQEQRIIASAETGLETLATKTVIPLFSNPVARSLVLGGFSLACFSWAHSELNRLRKLTPLPLNEAYRDIHKAILPHVLPEEVPEPFLLQDDGDDDEDEAADERPPEHLTKDDATKQQSSIYNKLTSSVPPRLQRHFKKLGERDSKANKRKDSSTWFKMKRMRDARKAESQKVRRMAIYDELVALQAIKGKLNQKQQKRKSKPKHKINKDSEEPLGYALVTGASRGIGRAIAVELARWEIPLILVARDVPRLTSLAYDLEACYGIRCCVLEADLSQPRAAEQIHDATKQAGLRVDIVVNNAGLSSTGLAVDMSMEEVNRMIGVNGLAVAQLAHLYGKDMKESRRGRILFVSSVVGAVSAGPTVALYAATKAFEKVLGLSLAKELEPYGVGVTCLMPGAVRDTDFRSSSDTKEALCWKLPYYTRSPATVAQQGIRALLAGDVEVTPGWQNRAFLKVFQPAMPQRLHNILVEIAWNPPRVPPFLKLWKPAEKRQTERQLQLEGRRKERVDQEDKKRPRSSSAQEWRPRSNTYLPPPLLLAVPGEREIPTATVPLKHPDPVPTIEPPLLEQEPPSRRSNISTKEEDASQNQPAPGDEEKESNGISEDQTVIESQYEELRKLSLGITSDADASDATEPGKVDPMEEESGESTPPKMEYHKASQNLEAERHLLQLREETLKLQQQVQAQERKQFLEQVELDRRQRELESEKRDMERGRKQQIEERETRGLWSNPSRQPAGVESQPEKMVPKPKLIVPSKPSQPRPPRPHRRDLMEESLEHPLFAP